MSDITLTQYVPAIRALAGRWLGQVAADPGVRAAGGDFVCSPAGLWLTLAAVAAGAREATAAELRKLLGVAGPDAAAAATQAARALVTDAVAVGTAVWARTPVYREFRESLPEIGFGHLDPARPAALDTWVREATRGLITALPERPDADALLVLVNALALTARWQTPFDRKDTRERAFTDAAGTEHGVPTMFRRMPFPQHAWTVPGHPSTEPGHSSPDDVDVVAIRCRAPEGQAPAQVSFVLGAPGRPADEVLAAAWAPRDQRRPVDADAVTIAVPRLSLRTHLDAARHLARLGLDRATSGLADFSGMSPEPLRISRVAQESLLKVDELGVEAASVTQTEYVTRSVVSRPPRIRHIAFDRPFGIVVFDGTTGAPLFTAWQSSAPRPA